LVSSGLVVLANSALAATMLIDAPTTVAVGSAIEVTLWLDPAGETVNAVEGVLRYPHNLLEFKSVSDGGSVVSLWAEKPHLTGDGLVSFAGVIPGGFSGVLSPYYQGSRPGKLWSARFTVTAAGQGDYALEGIRLLRHDGSGTAVPVTVARVGLRSTTQGSIAEAQLPADIQPPEPFKIELTRNTQVFSGQWFIAFATQDKDSGLDHYEVQEVRGAAPDPRLWVEAQSPYLLQDQRLRSTVYVRAVDQAGNERVVALAPALPSAWYENYVVWVIVIVGIVAAYVFSRYLKALWLKP
jgi:hypothetical protein